MLNEIERIKDTVVNKITVFTAIFMAPAYGFSLLRIIEIGWQNIFAYHTVLYGSILFLAVFRRRTKYWIKTTAICTIYLIVGLLGVLNLATSGGYYFIIITFAILAILVERKYAVYLLVATFGIYGIIAFGYSLDHINPSVNLGVLHRMPIHWTSQIISVFSIAVIFIYGFGEFYEKLLSALEKKDKAINDIEEANLKIRSHEQEVTNFIRYNISANAKLTFKKPMSTKLTLEEQVDWILANLFIEDCNDALAETFDFESASDMIGKPLTHIWGEGNDSRGIAKMYVQNDYRFLNTEAAEITHTGKKIYLLNNIYSNIVNDEVVDMWLMVVNITEIKNLQNELMNYRDKLELLVKERTAKLETANEELHARNDIIDSQNNMLKDTIVKLNETQAQLIEAEKMSSLGTLTAGVAHEINNPLNYILGAYEGLERHHQGANDKEVGIYLNALKTGVQRASGILQSLNQFSRDTKDYNENCNMHEIIDNSLTMLSNLLKHRISVVREFKYNDTLIQGNVGKLHQVFINIVGNAIDAIKDNGEIFIKTYKEDDYFVSEIKDDGEGIDSDHLNKIMDPFFTTKEPGRGTGLGLSLTYKIIKDHKGELEFESTKNIGTVAKIRLPISA